MGPLRKALLDRHLRRQDSPKEKRGHCSQEARASVFWVLGWDSEPLKRTADLSTLNPGWPGQMWGSDAKEPLGTVLRSLDACLPFLGAWLPHLMDPMPQRGRCR